MEMTIQEAALHLNVSINTIRRRLLSGVLTGTKVGTRWIITVNGNGPLREQLGARTREISELHQLLAVRSLNPSQHKPWWQFWR